ncbi:Auxin response factor 16 [Hibiscus syriacus]|uniref:Auxin response factor 16 n=1 Tax=Hibiscus syriacus TaxID=106335 RepID=A0A6A2Y9S5_HIBSY|nr:Auxin response factor 16 [Hibiscus syriacus]
MACMCWTTCFLPPIGSLVVYFPQGHSEQVAASMQKETDFIPSYPNLPSKLICMPHNLTLHADPETDEVYAQMTLQPVNKVASDTSTVPRRAAEKIFPPLDFSMQPPCQELAARDLQENAWNFRHIYRVQPKRHLLTTGWSVFVSTKRLFAGDSVLFIRDEKSKLLLGIRRANRQQPALSSSVISGDSMHIGILAAAAHAAANNSPFTIFYNPRPRSREYTDTWVQLLVSVTWILCDGKTHCRIFPAGPYIVRVGWDESTATERPRRASSWEIEPFVSPFFICPPPFFRPRFQKQPGMPDDGSDVENAFKRAMSWLGDEFGMKDPPSSIFPGLSLVQWMSMQQNNQFPTAQSGFFSSMASSNPLQNNLSIDDPSKLLNFQAPTPSNQHNQQQLQQEQPQQPQQQPHPQPSPKPQQQQPQPQPCPKHNSSSNSSVYSQLQQQQLLTSNSQSTQTIISSDMTSYPLTSLPQDTWVQQRMEHQPNLIQRQQKQTQLQQSLSQRTQQLPQIQQTVTAGPHGATAITTSPEIAATSVISTITFPSWIIVATSNGAATANSSTEPTIAAVASFSEPGTITCQNKPPMTMRSNYGLTDGDTLPCSTLPYTNNCQVSPSNFLNRSHQVPSTLMTDRFVEPPNTLAQELLSKPDIQIKHEPPTSRGLDQSKYKSSVTDQLEASSSGTSYCLDADTIQLNASVPTFLEGDVQSHSRNSLPFTANIDGLAPETLLTREYESQKDLQNMLSNCGGNSRDIDTELSTAAISCQPFGVPNIPFKTECSNDVAIIDTGVLNGGLWANQTQRMRTYTKVQKRGSVGRSIDVTRYKGYDELRHDLARMFSIEGQLEGPQISDWKLVYVDHENDILLAGDDPWEEFVSCVHSIKILSSAEVQHMSLDGDLGNVAVSNQAFPSPSLTLYGEEIRPHLRRFPSPSPAKSLTTIHVRNPSQYSEMENQPRGLTIHLDFILRYDSVVAISFRVAILSLRFSINGEAEPTCRRPEEMFNKKAGFTRMDDVDVVRHPLPPIREPSPHLEPSPDRPDYTPLEREPSPIPSHHRASSPPSPHDRRPAKMPRLLSPCSPPPPHGMSQGSYVMRSMPCVRRSVLYAITMVHGVWRCQLTW